MDSNLIRIFEGYRSITDKAHVRVIGNRGKILGPLPLYSHIRNHSREFEWGYQGSGPAQLALAICCATFGEKIGSDPVIYQEFKMRVVSRLRLTGWELLIEDVRQLPLFKMGVSSFGE